MKREVDAGAGVTQISVTRVGDNPDDGCGIADLVVDKLERQLSDHKKKVRNRKHPDQLTPRRGGSEG